MSNSCIPRQGTMMSLCLVLMAGAVLATVTDSLARRASASDDPNDRPLPLVNADEYLADCLRQAEGMIEKKEYARAIEVLQALLDRQSGGFVSEADGRSYRSLQLVVNKTLASMGPEGLALYRQLYDPQARKLYNDAMAKFDVASLRTISQKYFHTAYGPKSLMSLATLYFDRGQFTQAGRNWALVAHMADDGVTANERALLLAKAAVAYHLGSDGAASKKLLAELEKRYPESRATVAGKPENLVAFVQRMQAMPSPVSHQKNVKGWPGIGALPNGIGVMEDCDVVLAPQWRFPADAPTDGQNITGKLIARTTMWEAPSGRQNAEKAIKNRGGRVWVDLRVDNRSTQFTLPPAVAPVVADGRVIFRSDDCVVACDLLTGEVAWQSLPLPLEAADDTSSDRRHYYYYGSTGQSYGDNGWYGLTVGDGRIYALHHCDVKQKQPYYGNNSKKDDPSSSALAALSLGSEGSMAWTIGDGKGDDELLRHGMFLSVPTFDHGRLYVCLAYMEWYHLVCLDAATGGLLWKTRVAQMPISTNSNGRMMRPDLLLRGSIPVVADGQVFVVTNAGVAAAFDALTGQSLWAYQYDSDVNISRNGGYRNYNRWNDPLFMPPNRLIATKGLVICLPADGEHVLALSQENGRLVWSIPRDNDQYLTAIDANRVMLSSPGLKIISTGDGAVTNIFNKQKDISGRPAVTSKAILASGISGGIGKLYRVNLRNYKQVTETDLSEPTGLLGTLISVDGKLIAASAIGVCGYLEYGLARRDMEARLRAAAAAERPGICLQIAQLAFNARRFETALADLQEAQRLAGELDESAAAAIKGKMNPWMRRTYMALGNSAKDYDTMMAMFQKAMAYADTPQSKAIISISIMKCHQKKGEYAAAVEAAQKLSALYGNEQVVDVDIGPSAVSTQRFGADTKTVSAKSLGRDFIRLIVEQHPEAYTAQDTQAEAELTKALATGDADACAAVARKWPESKHAYLALFAAAELYYKKALVTKDVQEANEYFREAQEYLVTIKYQARSRSQRLAAKVGQLAILARAGGEAGFIDAMKDFRKSELDEKTEFASYKGKVRDIQQILRKERQKRQVQERTAPEPLRNDPVITLPLTLAYQLDGQAFRLLYQQRFVPVRVGTSIFAASGQNILRINVMAENAADAVVWSTPTSLKLTSEPYPKAAPGFGQVAGLTSDGKCIVAADLETIVSLDANTGKTLWKKRIADLGLATPAKYASIGEDVLVAGNKDGEVLCVDLPSGDVRWKISKSATTPYGPIVAPPQISPTAVMVSTNGHKMVRCFDIRTGKLLHTPWTSRRPIHVRLIGRSRFALLIDGTLSVRRIAKADEPLWKRSYEANNIPCIVDVSESFILLSPVRRTSNVEVISVFSGKRVTTCVHEKYQNTTLVPMYAIMAGHDIYIYYSDRRWGRLTPPLWAAGVQCLVAKFNRDTGKLLWSQPVLFPWKDRSRLMPMSMTSNYLVVTVQPKLLASGSDVLLLNIQDGAVAQKIKLSDQDGSSQKHIGPAVLFNGRMVVETMKGVNVYGEK